MIKQNVSSDFWGIKFLWRMIVVEGMVLGSLAVPCVWLVLADFEDFKVQILLLLFTVCWKFWAVNFLLATPLWRVQMMGLRVLTAFWRHLKHQRLWFYTTTPDTPHDRVLWVTALWAFEMMVLCVCVCLHHLWRFKWKMWWYLQLLVAHTEREREREQRGKKRVRAHFWLFNSHAQVLKALLQTLHKIDLLAFARIQNKGPESLYTWRGLASLTPTRATGHWKAHRPANEIQDAFKLWDALGIGRKRKRYIDWIILTAFDIFLGLLEEK